MKPTSVAGATVFKEPYIGKMQRAATLQSYRQYVNNYAKVCLKNNEAIAQYNIKTEVFIAQNNLHNLAKAHQQTFRSKYDSYNCKLSTEEYNNLIQQYNEKLMMPLLKKKLFNPIKQPQEETFETILFLYSTQLESRNLQMQGMGVNYHRPLQKAKISSHFIEKYKANGIQRLRYTEKTIRNHITRLRDAGVFTDYQYRGSGKPVEYHINPAILVVLDAHESKNKTADNQIVNCLKRKILPNKHVVNEIKPKKEKNKKEIKNVENIQIGKGLHVAGGNNYQNSYQNTHGQERERKKTSGVIFGVKDTQEFAKELSVHQYDTYQRHIGNEVLEKEAMYGTLTSDDFRVFLLQEFLRVLAVIWSGKTVYTGCFINAYNLLQEHYLINSNGSVPSKINLLYQFNNLLYRANWAKKFYRKNPTFQPLFPNDYLDPTRTQKSSGGFGYTLQKLIQHQQYIADKTKRKEQLLQKSVIRNRQLTAQQKVSEKVKQYVNGSLSLPQLHDYITQNPQIPNHFVQRLPYYIDKINDKMFFNRKKQ